MTGQFQSFAFLCLFIASLASGIGIWAWFTVKNRELDLIEKRDRNKNDGIEGVMSKALEIIKDASSPQLGNLVAFPISIDKATPKQKGAKK